MAETSDDSGEDEYESVRSKREPRKKRKKDLTPGKFKTHFIIVYFVYIWSAFYLLFEFQVYLKIHDILWTNFCKDSTLKWHQRNKHNLQRILRWFVYFILLFFNLCICVFTIFFQGIKKSCNWFIFFFQVETEEFIAGKSFDSFSQNTSRHEVQSKGSSKKAKKKKRKSIVGF